MEKILVPTDLGENSELSLQYAIDMGAPDKAQILLFNDAILENGLEESEKGLQEILEKIKSHQQYDAVNVEVQSDHGPVLEGINKKLKGDKYSLISMVTHDEEQIDFTIGSISTKVAQKGKAPALLVPENNQYQKVKNVLIVNDFTDSRSDEPAFKHLSTLIKKLDISISLLQAVMKDSKPTPAENPADFLGDVQPKSTEKVMFENYHELIEYVKTHAEKVNAQLLYIPSSQVVFEKIFVGNLSRQLALATQLPVYIHF
jgi:nucleotide-binding universal stress UspA family protein